MSIILHHASTPVPQHLKDCVAKIRQYSSIPIFLITDSGYSEDVIPVNISKYTELNWLESLDYYKDSKFRHTYRGSCFRVFYIQKLMQEKNLQNVLYFDNDVLLYKNPETIIEEISNKYDGFAVTAHNDTEVVMGGMSFIKNHSVLIPLIDMITNDLKNIKRNIEDTQLISLYPQCQFLPVLPTGITTNRYTNNFIDSVFDPSSYGQFIGGTDAEKKPGWFGLHQEIGKFIGNNTIKVIFENRNPFLIYQGNKIKINNLHIHSKNTRYYL